jgi:ABC-type sugar transport system ATPase subunit
MAKLELENLTKRFPGVVSVDGINLSVEGGEFVCLLGPSGCGNNRPWSRRAGEV